MTTRMAGGELTRLTAFSEDPSGGNPAGVWLGRELPPPPEMQRIAAEVGYSETAFLAPLAERAYLVRYFSPEAEVPFCGHATIASGVLLGGAHGPGAYRFETAAGDVAVRVSSRAGRLVASLTSVEPHSRAPSPELLAEALTALGWSEQALAPEIPPRLAYAGAWHLILAVTRREVLDGLDYDFDALKEAMIGADLTTVQIVWREAPDRFHSRNPFPVGGVVEDPATGAAAAALGGYLREASLIETPADFVIRQGEQMGRPSRIEVSVPRSGGITVTGTAVSLDASPEARGERAESLARSFLARVWSAPADLDAIDELVTEDYVIHSAGAVVRGREEFRRWVASFQERLEGATTEVLDVFADARGERVTTRWICRGANRGIFGLPPDGEAVAFSGIAVWRIEDGRLAECWVERSALEAVRARERARIETGTTPAAPRG